MDGRRERRRRRGCCAPRRRRRCGRHAAAADPVDPLATARRSSTIQLAAAVRAIAPGGRARLPRRRRRRPRSGACSRRDRGAASLRSRARARNSTRRPPRPISRVARTQLDRSRHAVCVVPVAGDLRCRASVAVRFGLKDVGTLIGTPPTTLTALPAMVTRDRAASPLPAGGAAAFVEDADRCRNSGRWRVANGDGT